MRIAPAIAGAAIVLGMAAAATPSVAAPAVPAMTHQNGVVLNVADWDGPPPPRWRRGGWDGPRFSHCRAWRNECSNRWGWGGWRFRRCLARHGC